MIRAIAKLITTMPLVDPGLDAPCAGAVGVAVSAEAERRGAPATCTMDPGVPRGFVCADAETEGASASVNARIVATSTSGNTIRDNALSMVAVSISPGSVQIPTISVCFFNL